MLQTPAGQVEQRWFSSNPLRSNEHRPLFDRLRARFGSTPIALQVFQFDWPPGASSSTEPAVIARDVRRALAAGTEGAQILHAAPVMAQGQRRYLGDEQVLHIQFERMPGYVRVQTYIVNGRVYGLSALGVTEYQVRSRVADRFFASFTVLR